MTRSSRLIARAAAIDCIGPVPPPHWPPSLYLLLLIRHGSIPVGCAPVPQPSRRVEGVGLPWASVGCRAVSCLGRLAFCPRSLTACGTARHSCGHQPFTGTVAPTEAGAVTVCFLWSLACLLARSLDCSTTTRRLDCSSNYRAYSCVSDAAVAVEAAHPHSPSCSCLACFPLEAADQRTVYSHLRVGRSDSPWPGTGLARWVVLYVHTAYFSPLPGCCVTSVPTGRPSTGRPGRLFVLIPPSQPPHFFALASVRP